MYTQRNTPEHSLIVHNEYYVQYVLYLWLLGKEKTPP